MAIVLEAPEEKKSRFIIDPPERPPTPASVSTKPIRQPPIPIRQQMRQQAFEQELSPEPSPTPRFTIESPVARSLPRYNRGEVPEGGVLGQAYRGYRQLPWIQRFNVEAAKVPQTIRERFLPEQPIFDPATGKVTQINVPLETLKGTTREVAATVLNFDTDVIAGLVAAGPVFRMLGGLALPTGQTLKQVFNTPLGKRFFSRAFLPKPIQAQSVAAAKEGFRPESVLIPPTRVTMEEAAEAAKQGAAQILSERPLAPEEILELYKIRYGIVPEPSVPTGLPPAIQQVMRASRQKPEPDTLIKAVRELGGIDPGRARGAGYNLEEDFRQFGLTSALRKGGRSPDDIAQSLQSSGALRVGEQELPGDALMRALKGRERLVTPSAIESGTESLIKEVEGAEFRQMIQQQMREIEQTPLHPAKAGRAALKNIFGDQAGFVALPEDEDALNAMLNMTKLGVSQQLPKFAENLNLTKVNDAALRVAMHESIERTPGIAASPKMTHAQLLKRAQEIADTPVINRILKEGELDTTAELIRSQSDRLTFLQKILKEELYDNLQIQLDQIIPELRVIRSTPGRLLEADKISAPQRQQVVALLDKTLDKFRRDPFFASDPSFRQKLMSLREVVASKELSYSALDKLHWFWVNSLMTVESLAKNKLGNTVFRWSAIPEKFF